MMSLIGNRRPNLKGLVCCAGLLAAIGSLAFAQPVNQTPTAADASPRDNDASQIRDELDEILSEPEFRRVRLNIEKQEPRKLPEWLRSFIDWLSELFGSIGRVFGALGIGIQAVAWTVLMLLVALIAYLIVRVIANYQRTEAARKAAGLAFDQGELPAAPGELAADVYLQRALGLASEGRYREAIGLLLMGLMSHAERAGLIRHRRGLTHRDYVRAVRGQPSLHQSFRQLVGVYEPICFGRREARPEHFQSSLSEYHSGLQHD
jgi:hypothetical protein